MYTYRSEKLGHELSLATAPGLGAALLTAGCTAVLAAGASPSRRFVNVAAALKVALVLRGSHLSNTTCLTLKWQIMQQIQLAVLDKQRRRKQTRPYWTRNLDKNSCCACWQERLQK